MARSSLSNRLLHRSVGFANAIGERREYPLQNSRRVVVNDLRVASVDECLQPRVREVLLRLDAAEVARRTDATSSHSSIAAPMAPASVPGIINARRAGVNSVP